MGKNKDLALILLIVIIGIFIPFLSSLVLTFGLDVTKADNLIKIGTAFGYFVLFFALEILVVFLYYKVTSKVADKEMDKYKPK